MMNYDAEKLESVRKRIALLRKALEDPSMLTEITVDGINEKFDRAQARQELKELECEEARLTGRSSRIYGIRL